MNIRGLVTRLNGELVKNEKATKYSTGQYHIKVNDTIICIEHGYLDGGVVVRITNTEKRTRRDFQTYSLNDAYNEILEVLAWLKFILKIIDCVIKLY